jgi:RNA polymerase sigma-70 factor, ECF subfamily
VSSGLFESFIAGLPAAARASFSADTTTATLEAHLAAAIAAWPTITVTDTRFVEDLARRLGPEVTPTVLERVCAPDVYLAIACIDGDSAAIELLDSTYIAEVDAVAGKLRASPDQAAEVKAQLRRVLLVDEPERPASLRDYAGRGNLRAYIRVIVTRDLIRAINRGRRDMSFAEDEILERLGTQHDPEISMLRAEYHGLVSEAMRAALVSLDERGRALLRYQLVDGWNVDQVARVYAIHRATAARWLVAVRETLGERIRTELGTRLKIDPDEIASIIRLVQSRVDVSLERLLGPAHDDTIAVEPPKK